MGIILDTSVLIAMERGPMAHQESISRLRITLADEDIGFSVITVMEMSHGITRAETALRRAQRRDFLEALRSCMTVHPVTSSIAYRAGTLDAECQAIGIRIALADLLIGTTALELGCKLVTANVRHFSLIPGLTVVPA